MKTLWRFMIIIGFVIFVSYFKYSTSSESCWIHDDVCMVQAELFQNLELSNGIAMQIDCFVNFETTNNSNNNFNYAAEDDMVEQTAETHPDHFAESYLTQRRYMGIQQVMLDGCQTPLNTHTYGLEFLPICSNVTKVSLQHYHMDSLLPLQCEANDVVTKQTLNLEYLHLQQNEIATIDEHSFQYNYPHLRVIELESNSIKVIQANTFRSLRSLEHLRIVNEPVLMLKFPDLFEFTAVISIHLENLREMTSAIFHHLPETLQTISVADTQFDDDAVEVNNARALSNLTITKCSVATFVLRDSHSSVKSINLNGNVLKLFEAHENNLKELDLSNNQLDYFDYEWLTNLTNLEVLSLRGNQLHVLSIYEMLKSIPNGHYVDLRGNRLQALQDADKEFPFWLTTHVRLKCDQNPWDCLWLHEFAHSHPEKFRILQYEKFISKINVNGLQCIPAEKPLEPQVDPMKMTKTNSVPAGNGSGAEKVANVSSYTVIYGGDQWEFKRNQRAEALIIVFMLPLGIAFLFLLLYMWIYCQKMFHLSYYKNFSCMRKQPTVPNPSQRFDVVRHLPAVPGGGDGSRSLVNRHDDATDGGYEVPLQGMCSECNCKPLTNSLERCNKPIHITYEESPMEVPHQIYEEIITVPSDHDYFSEECKHTNKFNHIHYDHLRFE